LHLICFPNILDVMVLENIKLSSDRDKGTWYKLGFLSSVWYIHCKQCIFQLYINFICTWT
jgi:hypothetical protein